MYIERRRRECMPCTLRACIGGERDIEYLGFERVERDIEQP